jgi:hypothetical protein
MMYVMRGSSLVVLFLALLLLERSGTVGRGQVKGAEPTNDELKKEVAALRELLKYQGTWKRTASGEKVRIEGERYTWIGADGKIAGTGKLKIIDVGKEYTKVDWHRLTGDGKGTSHKTIMRFRGEDTLDVAGSDEDYLTEFDTELAFKRIPK